MSAEKKSRRTFQSTRRANGGALRYYRELRDWTLHDLAVESGISYTQISRIETGSSRSPRTSTLKALAKALSVELDDLVVREVPTGIPDEPAQTEENREKLDAKREEWDQRDTRARGDGKDSGNGAGGREGL